MGPVVPSPLAAAFESKATISAPELCRLLPLDPKTLKRHCMAGHITYVQTGFGERRRFTLEAVMRFLAERSRTECPSTSLPSLRTTPTTSSGVVSAIVARQERLQSGRRRL
ncbi:helix-turn-helix domain-containing protein [uncultured Methylobacterium sp.]|uniref:helix-turn-helix domain-containing protein n=1 Tax=Methylobacterium ajmalii TaxID=2738439 RepID=UPI00338FE150|nr:helix-turn-helix domain-containing protein [Methylobacterium sp.]